MTVDPPAAEPDALREVVRLAAGGSTLVGGGAGLWSRALPQLALGDHLVDLQALGLDAIELPAVGAGVTLEGLAGHPDLVEGWPAVAEAAASTATPGVRALATVGGTVAARLPGCDLAAALDLHGADVVVEEPSGRRHRAFADYWVDADPGPHVVVGIVLGAAAPGCYRRVAARRGPAPAVATLAAVRRPDGSVELRAGAVADRPIAVDPVTGSVPPGAELRSDDRATGTHRTRLVRVLARDAVAALG